MKDQLIQTLDAFGYPVRQQGSLAPHKRYPPAFFTFWNDSSDGAAFYDNGPRAHEWEFTVYFYAEDADLVETTTEAAINTLRAAGWYIDGAGYDVASGDISYTGRAFDCVYDQRPAEME